MEALSSEPADELFGTETMAQLCVRQGRVSEAAGIYRRLVARAAGPERLRLLERLRQLEGGATPAAPKPVRPAETLGHQPARPVRAPVRSGQVIRAERGDAVVLAPVNAGAQVIADGHVHIYGLLRGAAIAGAGGCGTARIFCQRLEAELLGIAGVYATYEDIPEACRGRATQVALDGGRLVFEPL